MTDLFTQLTPDNNRLTIDFSPVHTRENAAMNEAHLEKFRSKFIKGCFDILKRLVRGERLTVRDAVINNISRSLPRRIKDLKEFGVQISDVWDNHRTYKTWFMTDSDKAKLSELLLSKMRDAA